MAIILETTGNMRPLDTLTRVAIQQAVGGDFHVVFTTDYRIMYVQAEAHLRNLPCNPVATRLYQYAREEPMYGDVVLLTEDETAQQMATDAPLHRRAREEEPMPPPR